MTELKEQIEAARKTVAHFRIKAERPSARLEDEFALEKARNRLLTLELRQLKCGNGTRAGRQVGQSRSGQGVAVSKGFGTKRERGPMTTRERAEAAFSGLKISDELKKEKD